jgi:hypothetical protein
MNGGRCTFALAFAIALALVLGAGRADGEDGVMPAGRISPGQKPVLDYLKSIGGRFTVAGIHNREPNSRPDLQTNQVHELVGRYPGLWSGDFLFRPDDVNSRWAMIYECRNEWERGSIVQLMMHVAPPNQAEGCGWEGGVLSHLTDREWIDLVTDGGKLNKVWKARLDDYAVYLAYLQNAGVQVLFRPFHEMNQGKFWWGGRKGIEGTARLYQITRDYFVHAKGLNNLVWVWDLQDMSRDFADYNPGADYWDVFAFDVYGDGYGQDWYDYVRSIAGNKPMAIGECAELPTPALLEKQPRWCFFMSWAELTFLENSRTQIVDLYQAPRVVTRERLPNFRLNPLEPTLEPNRPRVRPKVQATQARPALFRSNQFGTANIAPVAYGGRWDGHGAYLHSIMVQTQLRWQRMLAETQASPPSGTTVTVRFTIDSSGAVTAVLHVEGTSDEIGKQTCAAALRAASPFGAWTGDMVADLGPAQTLTFMFYYQ